MTNSNLADKEMIEHVKKGNYKALDEFYQDNKSPFIKWVYNHYKISYEEVQDLYHDAFEALVKKIILDKLDNLQFTLKSYFFGIAKHLIFQKFRQNKVYELKENHQPEDNFQMMLPDIEEEKLRIIIDCKKRLSAACQSILNLFYDQNKSMKEIAELLGYKNEDVVKTQKLRCITELKLCVKPRFTL